MDLDNFIKQEFLTIAESLPGDFIRGRTQELIHHFLNKRLFRLKKPTQLLLEKWAYENWQSYLKYESVASPFARLRGYPIYTPFEIFVDIDDLPEGIVEADYVITSGNQACINTGYDCLVVDLSAVNLATILKEVRR